jgi:hypothetical protein
MSSRMSTSSLPIPYCLSMTGSLFPGGTERLDLGTAVSHVRWTDCGASGLSILSLRWIAQVRIVRAAAVIADGSPERLSLSGQARRAGGHGRGGSR